MLGLKLKYVWGTRTGWCISSSFQRVHDMDEKWEPHAPSRNHADALSREKREPLRVGGCRRRVENVMFVEQYEKTNLNVACSINQPL